MILSQKKIEEIAVAVTKDFNEFFFGSETKDIRRMARGTPIDQFAKEYLGLEVSFAHLSPDGSICGLTAYADTEYITEEMGVKRTIPLRKNQILMDTSFIQPGQVQKLCGKRRFTLAHECAHQILFQMESETAQSAYAKKYSARTVYSLRDLKTREDWNEWQAIPGCGTVSADCSYLKKSDKRTGGRKQCRFYNHWKAWSASHVRRWQLIWMPCWNG